MCILNFRLSVHFIVAAPLVLFGCDADGNGSSTGDEATGDSSSLNEGDTSRATDRESDAQPADDDVLFPHAAGTWWTYRFVHEPGATDPGCQEGEWTARIIDVTTTDGVETVSYLTPCAEDDEQNEHTLQFEGDRVLVIAYEEPYVMLDTPVEDGYSWDTLWASDTYSYTWREAGAVTVPAGTFSDCWDRVDQATDEYYTYCRGVGRVSSVNADFHTELIDYHLAAE